MTNDLCLLRKGWSMYHLPCQISVKVMEHTHFCYFIYFYNFFLVFILLVIFRILFAFLNSPPFVSIKEIAELDKLHSHWKMWFFEMSMTGEVKKWEHTKCMENMHAITISKGKKGGEKIVGMCSVLIYVCISFLLLL